MYLKMAVQSPAVAVVSVTSFPLLDLYLGPRHLGHIMIAAGDTAGKLTVFMLQVPALSCSHDCMYIHYYVIRYYSLLYFKRMFRGLKQLQNVYNVYSNRTADGNTPVNAISVDILIKTVIMTTVTLWHMRV